MVPFSVYALTPHQHWQIQFAATIIRQGGVIAYPTETVWGLGCDPMNQQAVERIIQLKGRSAGKGLILVAGQTAAFGKLLRHLSTAQIALLESIPEIPTSWLIPDEEQVIPFWIKGKFNSVVVRLSRHPAIVALTARLGYPLVSTSANPAGKSPALSCRQARCYFSGQLDYYLPGNLGGYRKPSVIRSIGDGQLIRA